jgi:hypothetical protein
MLVFALGAGLLGAYLLARRHRRHHAWHHGWHHHRHGCGHHRHGHGGFGRGRRRWLLGRFFERLDATPAQERALVAELDASSRAGCGPRAATWRRCARASAEAMRRPSTSTRPAAAGLEAGVDAVDRRRPGRAGRFSCASDARAARPQAARDGGRDARRGGVAAAGPYRGVSQATVRG